MNKNTHFLALLQHLSLPSFLSSLFSYMSSSSVNMSTFSFTAHKKPAKPVDPIEVELHKEWDKICAREESLVAGAPADTPDKAAEQAEWVVIWQGAMVSTFHSWIGCSVLTILECLTG